jgi:plasmid stability protein
VGEVVIRNIDHRVIERLKVRAAAQRKSLEQSLRELLAEAARPSRADCSPTLSAFGQRRRVAGPEQPIRRLKS